MWFHFKSPVYFAYYGQAMLVMNFVFEYTYKRIKMGLNNIKCIDYR